ncbi:Glypican-5-like protein, partial [Leptotrombidium deliense]
MNNTLLMFKDVDKDMINETRALFTSLVEFVNDNEQEYSLKPKVHRYFRKLFPRFYINYIIDSQTINTDKQQLQSCIQSNSASINPLISAISGPLEETLIQTVIDVKYVISSVSLCIDVMNVVNSYQVSEKCSQEFTKLFYCKYCKGIVDVKPCFGLCMNTARQCISPLSDLDLKWIQFISTLKAFIHQFVVKNNIELLNAVVYKWMFKIFDSINEVNAKVRGVCSVHLRRKISTKGLLTLTLTPTNRRINYQQILLKQLNDFSEKVLQTKDFFNQMSDVWCKRSSSDDVSSESTMSLCWNGTNIENYSSLTSLEIESHPRTDIKFNVSNEVNAKIAELKLKLDNQIKTLLIVNEREEPLWPTDDEELADDYSGGSGFLIDSYPGLYDDEEASGEEFDDSTVRSDDDDDIIFANPDDNSTSNGTLTEDQFKGGAALCFVSPTLLYSLLVLILITFTSS